MRKAICVSYHHALGCDEFFSWVNDAESQWHSLKNLQSFTKAMLKSFNQAKAVGFVSDDLEHFEDTLNTTISDAMATVRALVVILNPTVGFMDTGLQDCLDVLTHDDNQSLFGTLKLHLQSKWWMDRFDEILKCGAENLITLQVLVDKWTQELQDSPPGVVCDAFVSLMDSYPEMKANSRMGQLKPLETVYKTVAVDLAKHFASLSDVGNVTHIEVRAVDRALEYFVKEAGVVEVKQGLRAWEGSMAASLSHRTVEVTLAEIRQIEDTTDKKVEKLANLLFKNQTSSAWVSASVKEDATSLIYSFMSKWEDRFVNSVSNIGM